MTFCDGFAAVWFWFQAVSCLLMSKCRFTDIYEVAACDFFTLLGWNLVHWFIWLICGITYELSLTIIILEYRMIIIVSFTKCGAFSRVRTASSVFACILWISCFNLHLWFSFLWTFLCRVSLRLILTVVCLANITPQLLLCFDLFSMQVANSTWRVKTFGYASWINSAILLDLCQCSTLH